MAKEFEQMKFMKAMVDYMRKESIISTERAKRLKTDIRKWWFIKSGQSEKMATYSTSSTHEVKKC